MCMNSIQRKKEGKSEPKSGAQQIWSSSLMQICLNSGDFTVAKGRVKMWANPIVGGIKLRVENLSRTKTQFNLRG